MLKNTRSNLLTLGLLLSCTPMTVTADYSHCQTPAQTAAEGFTAASCDISFTGALPSFACASSAATSPILGTYTVTNNTPVSITLGTPTLINNDGLPTSDVIISSNTCGSSLAARTSCLITVAITVYNSALNRTLEIPVNSRQVVLDSPVISPTGGCIINTPTTPSSALPCALGSTSSFGVLAGSTITNTGNSIIAGNLGLFPGTAVIGFPPGTVNGSQYIADATALAAQTDLTTLYNCLAAQPCVELIGTADQAGTLIAYNPGGVNVYCSGSSLLNSGTLTLNGQGNANTVFIFQAGSTLTMGPSSSIVLTNGTTAANVFWQLGSSGTLNSSTQFQGTIVALTSITLNT